LQEHLFNLFFLIASDALLQTAFSINRVLVSGDSLPHFAVPFEAFIFSLLFVLCKTVSVVESVNVNPLDSSEWGQELAVVEASGL